jgi:hypothetical protein
MMLQGRFLLKESSLSVLGFDEQASMKKRR